MATKTSIRNASTQRILQSHREIISNSTMLAIDPSSGSEASKAGWALYHKGTIVKSGIIDIDHTNTISRRLADTIGLLRLTMPPIDILVIERIRGSRAHEYLKWSVGVIIAAINAPIVVEISTLQWKQHCGAEWEKGDEQDAIAIGQAAIKLSS